MKLLSILFLAGVALAKDHNRILRTTASIKANDASTTTTAGVNPAKKNRKLQMNSQSSSNTPPSTTNTPPAVPPSWAAAQQQLQRLQDKSPSAPTCDRDTELTTLFKQLSKGSNWTFAGKIETKFETFHTQGLYKIDDVFYVSAVEIIDPTEKSETVTTDALYDNATDRTAGSGKAWVFKFDPAGEMLASVELTDGDIYHPGGIDYDGKYLWVPVAEYRPNSQSNLFLCLPESLECEKIFDYPDHIGGVVHNVHSGTLHAVSWGSRRLYEFPITYGAGETISKITAPHPWAANPQTFIDYQDCHYQGVDYMVCGGVNKYETPAGEIAFGGLDLVDLRRNTVAHSVPVKVYIDEFGDGPDETLVASNNAYFMEPISETTMRLYFQTETENKADVVVYDVTRYNTNQYPEAICFGGGNSTSGSSSVSISASITTSTSAAGP